MSLDPELCQCVYKHFPSSESTVMVLLKKNVLTFVYRLEDIVSILFVCQLFNRAFPFLINASNNCINVVSIQIERVYKFRKLSGVI